MPYRIKADRSQSPDGDFFDPEEDPGMMDVAGFDVTVP